jgi:tetratricopeptide (TPR) repeat protein
VASALIRCGLVALALAAGAWLVIGYRAVELEADATTVAPGARAAGVSPEEARRALDALDRARLLSADTRPLLNQGLLLFATGRREHGIAVAKRVVREEPENIDGWLSLYYLYLTEGDSNAAAEAAREVRALNPLAGDELER